MYCEGFWGEGVCIADMSFCGEPTADFDSTASYVRRWYEAHRESWFDRHQINPLSAAPDRSGVHADEFMLGFLNEVYRVDEECKRQTDGKRR